MNRVLIAVFAVLTLATVPAAAQDIPAATSLGLENCISPGQVQPTPEMWFYQQYKNDYLDPKMAVREKAEFKALQRQRRIAARKWFGFSNARPTHSTDPFNGDFSPRWTSNNPFYPFRWQGTSRPWVATRTTEFGLQIY